MGTDVQLLLLDIVVNCTAAIKYPTMSTEIHITPSIVDDVIKYLDAGYSAEYAAMSITGDKLVSNNNWIIYHTLNALRNDSYLSKYSRAGGAESLQNRVTSLLGLYSDMTESQLNAIGYN